MRGRKRKKRRQDEEKRRQDDENKRQDELKRRMDEYDRDERAAERELKKMQLELDLEHEHNKGLEEKRHLDRESVKGNRTCARAPKLPQFQEDKDDIDAYLERYERYATAQDWKKSDWATNLSALLGGKALEVYYRMPKDKSDNYLDLKAALLKRYNLTEEGFRDRFYHS